MMSDWRVVIDSSVAVSAALLPRSVPRQAFDLAITRCRVLISASTIFELDEVLRRPKFNPYVSEMERLEFLAALVTEAEIVEIHEAITECRDPKDDKFLELAVSGQATHLISGDADLLSLHPFRGIAILTPQAFLDVAK
jgi:putative PIN family toxin of toxin-antitoxin system